MDLILHQNLRTFSGNDDRTQAYSRTFEEFRDGFRSRNPFIVGGFTEVLSGNCSDALNTMANSLNMELLALVACGRTALAAGAEYVAIAVRPGVTIESVGRIMLKVDGGGTALHHEYLKEPGRNTLWSEVPPEATPDYRGVVYVVVGFGEINLAVGFIHNRYSSIAERLLIAGKIPEMGAAMASNPAMASGGHIFLGGDFNVDPVDRSSSRGLTYHCYHAGLAANQVPPRGRPGGTLSSGHLYDYWYSNTPAAGPWHRRLDPPVAGVVPSTLADRMSDHCGTTLRIR